MNTRADDDSADNGPVVRRPQPNAPRTKSKLRVSFNPGEEDGSGTGPGTGASTPAAESSTQAMKRTSSRLGLAQDILSRREQSDQDDSKSRYSRAHLDELRTSTPSTPRDTSSPVPLPSQDLIASSANLELDLESKFGKPALHFTSHIPSAAEIREKKDRRARLAKEAAANAYSTTSHSASGAGDDFISLEDYDSDGEFRPHRMQVGTHISQPREKDTRLIHEDEDIAEGFDDFVEDTGRVTLSRKGLREQSRQEKEAIRNMIVQAEGSASEGSDNDNGNGDGSSDSDYERRKEYELAQTHHGMDGLRSHTAHTNHLTRPQQPREITPIPKLSVGLTRLRDMLSALEFERGKIVKRQADNEREKTDVKASQEHIQRSLEEAGQELQRVEREHAEKLRHANGQMNGNGTTEAPPATAVESHQIAF